MYKKGKGKKGGRKKGGGGGGKSRQPMKKRGKAAPRVGRRGEQSIGSLDNLDPATVEVFRDYEERAKSGGESEKFVKDQLMFHLNVMQLFPSVEALRNRGDADIPIVNTNMLVEDVMGISRNIRAYNRAVVENVKHLMVRYHSILVNFPTLRSIVLHPSFRNDMYDRWYRVSMTSGRPFAQGDPRFRDYQIPLLDKWFVLDPDSPSRQDLIGDALPTSKWFSRFVQSAVLGNYLDRVTQATANGFYFIRQGITHSDVQEAAVNRDRKRFLIEDFYKRYFLGAAADQEVQQMFLDPRNIEQPEWDQYLEEETAKMPDVETTAFWKMVKQYDIKFNVSDPFAYLYLQASYGMLPGSLEMGILSRFHLVSSDKDGGEPEFPGSSWLAHAFDVNKRLGRRTIHVPWHERITAHPELEYYAMIRRSLRGHDGCDVFRIPVITFDGVDKSEFTPLNVRSMSIQIEGTDHVLYVDEKREFFGYNPGNDDDDDDDDDDDSNEITIGPLPIIPSESSIIIDMRWLRFAENTSCIDWFDKLVDYSHWMAKEWSRVGPADRPNFLINFSAIYRTMDTSGLPIEEFQHRRTGEKNLFMVLTYKTIPEGEKTDYIYTKPILARERVAPPGELPSTYHYGYGDKEVPVWTLVERFVFTPDTDE